MDDRATGNGELLRQLAQLREENRKLRADRVRLVERERADGASLMLDTIDTHVFCLTDPATYGMVNRAHANFFGYSKEQLAFQGLDKLPDSGQAGICIKGNAQVFATREPYIGEEILTGADGEVRTFLLRKLPRIGADGEVEYLVCTGEDITERKRAEQSLLESEARFKAFHEASSGGIAIHHNGIVLECNRGLCEISGYTRDELIGTNGLLLIAAEFRSEVVNRIVAGSEASYEVVGIRKNGEHFPVLVMARNVPYKGRMVRTTEFRDLSSIKRTQAELRQLKNYLANIIDSMPSVLVGIDAAGCVTQWNSRAVQRTGIDAEQARGRSLYQLMPWLADEAAEVSRSITQRKVIHCKRKGFQSGEENRYEEVTIFPLTSNGSEGAVLRVDDVTERVRLEEMMIQSEKMLSVGSLAAGMAHAINNPLVGVMQTSAVLSSRLLGDLPANHRAAEEAGTTLQAIQRYLELRRLTPMLESIHQSGSQAAGVAKNMLSFARKREISATHQDIGVLLDQTIDLLTTDYHMKKNYDFSSIEIVREYQKSAAKVYCEASKLQQVFMNIMKNGVEAMAENRSEGAPARFVLRIRDDGEWVSIEIEDNGPGMDENTSRRIYEPLFTTKPKGQGTGLGLSVAFFIITQNHGGEMSLRRAPGRGCCFVIRLPKSTPNALADGTGSAAAC
ncbi:MAG: PAS domain S-box protein [Gammaproteobacteria bacterium]|nr:PAS domain S-box protein [Gammaproteobacteria bacterium]